MKNERSITLPALAEHLLGRATEGRIIMALAGPPGAGKSTCAEQLVKYLDTIGHTVSAIIPMDGYHFDDLILNERGLRSRKGAPETFDVAGLRHMLQRLRINVEHEIAVPVFDRALELSRASARLISSDVKILIVEGNYLLLNCMPWSSIAQYFDLTVSIRVSEEELRRRLIDRWHRAGRDDSEAQEQVDMNDLPNGHTVLAYSVPADFVLEVCSC